MRSYLRELRRPDPGWSAAMSRLPVRTLFVVGGPSSHIRQDRSAALAAVMPDAAMQTIAVGHRIHSLAPDGFAALVIEWLDAGT